MIDGFPFLFNLRKIYFHINNYHTYYIMRVFFKAIKQTLTSIKHYPFKEEIPRAIPKTLASFIIQENSDPWFLRNDVTFCELVSFCDACIIID